MEMKKCIIAIVSFFWASVTLLAGERYTEANLNLRSGPGTDFRVLLTIPQGTIVEMYEDCDCEWVAVEYRGEFGYISSKYLSKYYHRSSGSKNARYKKQRRGFSSKKRSSYEYYTNSNGDRVQSPTYYNEEPAGATAKCRDGTYSFSRSRRGTCSHHGGVAIWL